jgi:hypothetical protein
LCGGVGRVDGLSAAGRIHFGVFASWSEAAELVGRSSDGYARLTCLVRGDPPEQDADDWFGWASEDDVRLASASGRQLHATGSRLESEHVIVGGEFDDAP